MPKGNPIPTKFEADEEAMLKWVAKKSGLSVSEVIRRSFFLLHEEIIRRGGKVGWIVEELTPARDLAPMPGAGTTYDAARFEALRVAEEGRAQEAAAKKPRRKA